MLKDLCKLPHGEHLAGTGISLLDYGCRDAHHGGGQSWHLGRPEDRGRGKRVAEPMRSERGAKSG
jgi:hypothetical protein